ncbi:LytR C-terminal domain-containing protein [Bifidobacterium sp.]|uniref:LytR C-terminal domain-containing protein n=1 Tax=Bifidobacterium sp. TaxID=41200 RepID=UPI0039ED2154
MGRKRNERAGYDSYTRDEFDNPPAGPMGVHRGTRSLAARTMPYFVVLLVAVLLGFLAWALLSGAASSIRLPWASSSSTAASSTTSKSESSSASDTSSSSSSATSTGSASSSASTSPSTSTSSSSTSSEAVNKATSIRVINGTSVSGYAAKQKAVLNNAGYTNVVAANPTGSVPSSSVVWYQNETDKSTAEAVASSLGISTVSQMTSISAPIVAVLLE